jgi:hypothetical protein
MNDESSPPELNGRASVDYMLRTVQQNSIQLTMIADQKANILIGIIAICWTLTLSNAGIATLPSSLVAFNLFGGPAAIFALMALSPRPRDPSAAGENGYNPLIFSSFAQRSRADYLLEMRELVQRDDRVYQAIFHDIHAIGQVLDRKYRFLRYAYRVFFLGVVSAGAIFVYELWPRLSGAFTGY